MISFRSCATEMSSGFTGNFITYSNAGDQGAQYAANGINDALRSRNDVDDYTNYSTRKQNKQSNSMSEVWAPAKDREMPTVNILTRKEEILIMKKHGRVIMHPANFSGFKKSFN